MRIGIDCRLWNETGVGRYIRNLVRYLSEIDKKNEYVLFVRKGDYQRIKDEGLRINWKIVEADIRWHSVDEQLQFSAIIAKEHVDLMHFPYFSVPIGYSGKFVVTIHDLIPLHFNTGRATTLPVPLYKAKRLGYKLVLRKAVAKASKIIAVSNSTKDEVVKYLHVDPEKVVVTYEGVDSFLYSSNERKRVEKSAKMKFSTSSNDKQSLPFSFEKRNYFLYVGNAYPHKNLERLLEVFKLAFARDSSPKKFRGIFQGQNDMKLVLVGKEDYFYKRLKEKVREMELEERVVFHIPKDDGELAYLYQHAKALVMPSLMEGFGLPPLEAMANNCLVLASDIPALREVCGEAAIYFNPYDVDDMKKKMELVCSNDLDSRSKKIALGAKRVKEFSWKKMAIETLKIYEEVGH